MYTSDLFLNEYSLFVLCALILLIASILFYIGMFIKNYYRLRQLDKRLEDANSIHLEAINPVEEAKIFACYGKFEQAIKILKWQIKAFPKEIIPYTELFIIYIHQKDKEAYYKLLESLPYDQKSSQYQGFLANAKLSFTEHPIEKSQTIENIKSHLTVANTSDTSKAVSAETLSSSKADKKSVLSKQSIKEHKFILLRSKLNYCINKLSPLEESVFLAFKGNTRVHNKLMKKKKAFKDAQNFYKNTQLKSKKQVLIRVKKQLDTRTKHQAKEIQNSIIKKFQKLLLAKHELKGISYLEHKIKQNPLQEKLYPILIQSYIELRLFDMYLSFRKDVFSHTIQPEIDIILLIIDAENRFTPTQTKLKQVA